MIQTLWVPESRKTTVCIDSYDSGILCGRFYGAYQDSVRFESLSQFLVNMDSMLEESQIPQAYTASRTFSPVLPPAEVKAESGRVRKGTKATFELQILFRQHTSWQGVIIWQEKHLQQRFRSVLELIFLMDSALRDMEGSEAC